MSTPAPVMGATRRPVGWLGAGRWVRSVEANHHVFLSQSDWEGFAGHLLLLGGRASHPVALSQATEGALLGGCRLWNWGGAGGGYGHGPDSHPPQAWTLRVSSSRSRRYDPFDVLNES